MRNIMHENLPMQERRQLTAPVRTLKDPFGKAVGKSVSALGVQRMNGSRREEVCREKATEASWK